MSGIKMLRAKANKIEKATKGIREFIAEIVEKDSFVQTDVFMAGESFLDGSEALGEGVICGYANLGDYPVTIIAQNAEVLGGSLGKAHADKILKAIDRAQKTKTPLISIIDSRGARLGEGLSALEGYAAITAKVSLLKRNVPHIAIINGNAIGHMSIYAQTADIMFMGKDGIMSFNPPMAVLASSGSAKAPGEVFCAANHAKHNNTCAFTYEKPSEIKHTLNKLFDYMQKPIIENEDNPNRVAAELNKAAGAQALLEALCDEKQYLELYAGFAPSVKTVITSVNSISAGIVQTKADGVTSLLDENAVKKIAKFVSFLQAYHIPLITLIDCEGVKSDIDSELGGISAVCAELAECIAASGIAKIAVVTGSAIGYAYTVLCSKALGFDYTLAFADSTLLPINADTAISVINVKEIESASNPVAAREKLAEFYKSRQGNPFIAGKEGYIDNIIEPALLRPYVASILTALER
ncbi:MAG: carboxyl transferase domain-containing protein [Christensenellales bacterium]|jgi:acetyl-CoA carboxylase carboxyltransferase component